MPEARSGEPDGPVGVAVVRAANTARVSRLLREHGPATRAQLGGWTGLARPTLTAIVQDLAAAGVIRRAGAASGAATGRPGALWAVDPRHAGAAVAAVRGADVQVRFVDADGTVLGIRTEQRGAGLDAIELAIVGAARGLERQCGVPLRALAALLGGRLPPPGQVDDESPARGFSASALRDRLREALDVPVVLVNPAAAAAVGEALRPAHDVARDLLLVFLDHGVGTGLVQSGLLTRGAHGAAGEFGHTTLPGNDRPCRCGKRGCLETVSAGWAILEQVEGASGRALPAGVRLAQLESLGDPVVDRVLERAADTLGGAISWLVDALDPQAVHLGGSPFAEGADRFLQRFESAVCGGAARTNRRVDVRAALPESDFRGAAQLALETLPAVSRPLRSLGGGAP